MGKAAFAGLCVGAAVVGSGIGYVLGKKISKTLPDRISFGGRTYVRKTK